MFHVHAGINVKQQFRLEYPETVFSTPTMKIWLQMEEQRAGKHTDLPDFIFSFFQKRVGIPTAVVEVPLPDTRDGFPCSHALGWPCVPHDFARLLPLSARGVGLQCCMPFSCSARPHAVLHGA